MLYLFKNKSLNGLKGQGLRWSGRFCFSPIFRITRVGGVEWHWKARRNWIVCNQLPWTVLKLGL